MIRIRQAETPDDVASTKALILEYLDWTRREIDKVEDLATIPAFFDMKAELENLPGIFSPPTGSLLLATSEDRPAGCGALKRLDNGRCELKRVYVRPDFRGAGIGRKLVESLVESARQMQYRTVVLDTHIDMVDALRLYAACGFTKTAPYYPITEVESALWVFMKRELT